MKKCLQAQHQWNTSRTTGGAPRSGSKAQEKTQRNSSPLCTATRGRSTALERRSQRCGVVCSISRRPSFPCPCRCPCVSCARLIPSVRGPPELRMVVPVSEPIRRVSLTLWSTPFAPKERTNSDKILGQRGRKHLNREGFYLLFSWKTVNGLCCDTLGTNHFANAWQSVRRGGSHGSGPWTGLFSL